MHKGEPILINDYTTMADKTKMTMAFENEYRSTGLAEEHQKQISIAGQREISKLMQSERWLGDHGLPVPGLQTPIESTMDAMGIAAIPGLVKGLTKSIIKGTQKSFSRTGTKEFIKENQQLVRRDILYNENNMQISLKEAGDLMSKNKNIFKTRIADDEILMNTRNISNKTASQYDAHGIAKGDNLENLVSLLDKGLKKGKSFHTTKYVEPIGSRTGLGSFGGAYKDGQFVLLSEKGQMLVQGGKLKPSAVIVNESAYKVIPKLQERYPHIKFIKANEQEAFFGVEKLQWNTSNSVSNFEGGFRWGY